MKEFVALKEVEDILRQAVKSLRELKNVPNVSTLKLDLSDPEHMVLVVGLKAEEVER